MKAMILAAGKGQRMLPLTQHCPKPLLTVGNTTLIEKNIHALKQAGVSEIIINIHYHGHQISDRLGNGERYGIPIRYSDESQQLLGTGGGIHHALPLLGDEPFIVIGSDIWTDYPLKNLTSKNVSHAHLILVPNPSFHPCGDFSLNDSGKVTTPSSPTVTFASIGVFHPQLFANSPSQQYELSNVLNPAINDQLVTGEIYNNTWWNVGTPELLHQLNQSIKKQVIH